MSTNGAFFTERPKPPPQRLRQPLPPPEPGPMVGSLQLVRTGPAARAHALIVAGDATQAETLSACMNSLGVSWRLAGEFRLALSELEREPPDLIVLDLETPLDTPGRDWLKQLLRLQRQCGRVWNVIALGGAKGLRFRRDAARFGACTSLPKPVNPAALARQAKIQLEFVRMQDRLRWHGAPVVSVGEQPPILLYAMSPPRF